MDLHCEILWADNTGENLGRQPIKDYTVGIDDAYNQEIFSQHRLMFSMIGLCIKNSLNTKINRKLRAFSDAYTFNT